jgi:dolichol-phosphate mannosyltransferase
MVRGVPRTLVCIPTFDEAANILPLIDAIHAAAEEVDLLVIDDASPDGTGELVRERTLKDPFLNVMSRPGKLGLGSAYMAGFAYGLQHGYQSLVTMDADFSHPPAQLRRLLAAVDDGVNLAIGSRYVPGGAVEGWGFNRRLLSAGGNAFARSLLSLQTHDCTSGFRCYGLRAVQFLVTRALRSSGYSALIELLARCERAGFTIAEIPITFVDRMHGKSKISRQEIGRAIVTVLRLGLSR